MKSIRFYNYKGFEDTGVIELKPVTLLLGKNNSGKSSLIKGLHFLHAAFGRGDESEMTLIPVKGVRLGDSFADLFHNNDFTNLGADIVFRSEAKYSFNILYQDGVVKPVHFHASNPGSKVIFVDPVALPAPAVHDLMPTKYLSNHIQVPDFTRFEIYHIGPMRIQAPDSIKSSDARNGNYVGVEGENTYNILLHSFLKETELFGKVAKWMADNMDGALLSFAPLDMGQSMFRLYVVRNGQKTNIADSGFGLSQVLPIITQSFIPGQGAIVTIEQPVLHLHPACHEAVANRLADSAKQEGYTYVIESHSKNLPLALRLKALSPDDSFSREDLAMYYINNEEPPAHIRSINVTERGTLDYWPTGVFGEDNDLLERILDLKE